jgi:hypothetical protein
MLHLSDPLIRDWIDAFAGMLGVSANHNLPLLAQTDAGLATALRIAFRASTDPLDAADLLDVLDETPIQADERLSGELIYRDMGQAEARALMLSIIGSDRRRQADTTYPPSITTILVKEIA